MSNTNKLVPRNKFSLGLLHQIIGHISIKSLMDVDNANVWKDIEPMIDPYPFCFISSMNIKYRPSSCQVAL